MTNKEKIEALKKQHHDCPDDGYCNKCQRDDAYNDAIYDVLEILNKK